MLVGAGMTFIVQSSSVFTSAITPLVGQYRNPVDWTAYQTVESLVTSTADRVVNDMLCVILRLCMSCTLGKGNPRMSYRQCDYVGNKKVNSGIEIGTL